MIFGGEYDLPDCEQVNGPGDPLWLVALHDLPKQFSIIPDRIAMSLVESSWPFDELVVAWESGESRSDVGKACNKTKSDLLAKSVVTPLTIWNVVESAKEKLCEEIVVLNAHDLPVESIQFASTLADVVHYCVDATLCSADLLREMGSDGVSRHAKPMCSNAVVSLAASCNGSSMAIHSPENGLIMETARAQDKWPWDAVVVRDHSSARKWAGELSSATGVPHVVTYRWSGRCAGLDYVALFIAAQAISRGSTKSLKFVLDTFSVDEWKWKNDMDAVGMASYLVKFTGEDPVRDLWAFLFPKKGDYDGPDISILEFFQQFMDPPCDDVPLGSIGVFPVRSVHDGMFPVVLIPEVVRTPASWSREEQGVWYRAVMSASRSVVLPLGARRHIAMAAPIKGDIYKGVEDAR